ncbi:MAG: biotin/lipoyl-binding protein [Chloroflexota bacterium]|nr:biotin/lipoyl-binding protein [Chloroflexota bacterium]
MDAEGDRQRLLAALPGLLREMAENGVRELEVSAGDASLYVRQRPGLLPPLASSEADVGADVEGLVAVSAPLAGVFYGAPAPDQPAFVSAGEAVEAGQMVALVEAMKVFNEIHVEVSGVIVDVLLTDGQAVRAGQVLMTVRPDPPPPYADPPSAPGATG